MAVQLSPPSAIHGLERSLRRVLRKRDLALASLEPGPIHDVRVALRRCRSLAEGFANLDPHPIWRKLRKTCKKQQRALADLRDIQVLKAWLPELGLSTTGSPAESVGAALSRELEQEETAARKTAKGSLKDFPRKRWKHWLQRLPERAQLIYLDESRLAEIALERLGRVRRLDRRWQREHSMAVWHRLRVAVKRFRYVVESFLPVQNAAWKSDLKKLQDMLGEGHDLDVLRAKVAQVGADKNLPKASLNAALRRIDAAIAERISGYEILVRARPLSPGTRGRERKEAMLPEISLWDRWRVEMMRVRSSTSQDDGASAESPARSVKPVKARIHRFPDKPLRTSSAR